MEGGVEGLGLIGIKGHAEGEIGVKGMIGRTGQEIKGMFFRKDLLKELGHLAGQTVWKEGMSGQMAGSVHVGR